MEAIEIVNLTGFGLPTSECRKAGKWMAKAFAQAPAKPALAIFFGTDSYASNIELHETFWAAHLNRVAMSGILLGARENNEWRGFRCFFKPGHGRLPYMTDFRLDDHDNSTANEDWDRFLTLTGTKNYTARIAEWSDITSQVAQTMKLDTTDCYTTSIIVVDPEHQRRGTGKLLDDATQKMAVEAGRRLFVRIHEYILPFYEKQGYQVLTSAIFTLGEAEPFKVHFLMVGESS